MKKKNIMIEALFVMDSCPNRKDLLAPNELIRDAEGKIVGCKSLSVHQIILK